MQVYKALISYAVSIADIADTYFRKATDFLASHSKMQSPIEIAVNGRATALISPLEMSVDMQPLLLLSYHNGYSPTPSRVMPYTPTSDSKHSKGTQIYKGLHRNYTPKPRKKHMPVRIINVNWNNRRYPKVTERWIPYVRHSRMFR